MGQAHPFRMTNAESLASVVTALGGTPSGKTNTELIAEIVTALGGTPAGDSNDEMLAALASAAGDVAYGTAQTKTAAPATSSQEIKPDAGKVLTKVTVSAVTSAIDANIAAGNIKKDVAILGVTGTYEGSGGGGSWALWDGETAIADSDGNALYDVYFVLPVAGSSPAATVSSMIPKGGAIEDGGDIALTAGGYTPDYSPCLTDVYIGVEGAHGSTTVVPLTPGDPPVAGTVAVTEFSGTLGTDVLVYIRDSQGLPS